MNSVRRVVEFAIALSVVALAFNASAQEVQKAVRAGPRHAGQGFRLGPDAVRHAREDVRPGQADAEGLRDGPRLRRRPRHHRRRQARHAGPRHRVEPGSRRSFEQARGCGRGVAAGEVRARRHVRGRHLEGHGARPVHAAGPTGQADAEIPRDAAGLPHHRQRLRHSRLDHRRDREGDRRLRHLVHRPSLHRAGAGRGHVAARRRRTSC